MIKKCKNCGRDFETGKGNKRYCKEDCFREIRREQHRDEYYRNIETHTRCSKAYYETHKEQWGEYQKRKRAKDPGKRSANAAVERAVNQGKVRRPNYCSQCNIECRPEAHHEDYSRPLDVIFLCRKCHMEKHRNYN